MGSTVMKNLIEIAAPGNNIFIVWWIQSRIRRVQKIWQPPCIEQRTISPDHAHGDKVG